MPFTAISDFIEILKFSFLYLLYSGDIFSSNDLTPDSSDIKVFKSFKEASIAFNLLSSFFHL